MSAKTSRSENSTDIALNLAILCATVLMWMFSLTDEFVPPLLAMAAVLIVWLPPAQVALAGFSWPTMILLLRVGARESWLGKRHLTLPHV